MKIVRPEVRVLLDDDQGMALLRRIETAGRECYKSCMARTPEETIEFVRGLIEKDHTAMLEHASVSVEFITDRGISHELVRHRVASFAQESTRYCNYSKDKFGNQITVIEPIWGQAPEWMESVTVAERAYFELLSKGWSPELARSVLPTCLKTTVYMTANIREWRHIFNLRCLGTTGKPHPEMRLLMFHCLEQMSKMVPGVFEDQWAIAQVIYRGD